MLVTLLNTFQVSWHLVVIALKHCQLWFHQQDEQPYERHVPLQALEPLLCYVALRTLLSHTCQCPLQTGVTPIT
jgi:hypothetical protein